MNAFSEKKEGKEKVTKSRRERNQEMGSISIFYNLSSSTFPLFVFQISIFPIPKNLSLIQMKTLNLPQKITITFTYFLNLILTGKLEEHLTFNPKNKKLQQISLQARNQVFGLLYFFITRQQASSKQLNLKKNVQLQQSFSLFRKNQVILFSF